MDDRQRPSVEDELDIPTGGSRDPFASAVRTTRMPMVITDPRRPDNPIVFCNEAFVRLTGYPRDEVLGRNCRFLQGPATRDDAVARVREAIEAPEPVQVDLLNYRKDGTTFWNALLLSPVFEDGRLVYFFASQMDVTDRKRSEEHAFLLQRELEHRVKNTLATVQTIVAQTLRQASVPAEVAVAVAGRLRALARSHDVMTREAWGSALVGDVVRGALDPLHDLVADRLHVEGPDVRIKPRIATMLSLAVHELGENARRHGALSNATGTVSLVWTLADRRFRLSWREAGGPAVAAPSTAGYGVKIIERVLAAEFAGTADLAFREDGVVFELDAPADGLGTEQSEWKAP
ncbi:MAG: HWE histidine kinase domain-containing protein [Methylobacterium sp.]